MKIKQLLYIGIAALTLASCNDDFLERYPEDTLTEKNFFKNVKDLEAYNNGLYSWGASTDDNVSDNTMYCESSSLFNRMQGLITPEEVGQWSWTRLRSINFLICRIGQCEGAAADINHNLGLARLYRAKEYYSKVQTYSDVPWYSKDLQTTDEDELYKTQDPRSLVVDSIMADLEFAVNNIKDGSSKTKIYKVVALYEQARIALNEGTFRKYHSELGLTDYDKFLRLAVSASQAIMDNYSYKISTSPSGSMPAYRALFSSLDLSTNPEVILMQDNDKALGRKYYIGTLFNYNHSISRSLMEDYLYITEDGKAVPFTSIDGYETMTVTEVGKNRDPRMEETIMPMGWTKEWSTKPEQQKIEFGGYSQVKFCRDTPQDMWGWGEAYNDLPIIRYARVLLINAEAKAELGILTQDDVDATINQLRRRVGMPDANLAEWLSNPDPVQIARYHNISSSQKGAVAEIRRERRVELACEGVRYNDLIRWGLGKLLAVPAEGIYIPHWGYFDTNGDGLEDCGLFPTSADADAAKALLSDDARNNVTTLIVDAKSPICLSEGDHGHIRRVSHVNANFEWVEPKYYYNPISVKDINLNPNLVQNKWWAD
ncbi:MAG: RagB/SusD family nutrient uptake outer membrane protein [Muribaculaceae bacterium]